MECFRILSYDNYKNALYQGPSTWGEYAEICATGDRQSPIDLVESPTRRTLRWGYDPITFANDYWNKSASGKFSNNGHTGNIYIYIYNAQRWWSISSRKQKAK